MSCIRPSVRDATWSANVPAISFAEGASSSVNLLTYTSGFNPAQHDIVLASGSAALPSGVTLSTTGTLSYDGVGAAASAPGCIFEIRDDLAAALAADWAARGTEGVNGVTFACDFSGPNDFVTAATNGGHVFAGGMNPAILARVVKDTTDGLTNGCCLRIDTPADAGANSAAWMFPFARNYTSNASNIGNDIYLQFRFKIPASRLALSNCGGNQRGWKLLNLAQYSITNTQSNSYSNTTAEHVLQDTDQRGMLQAYNRDTAGSFPPFQGFADGQITLQTAIDRGAPLTGGDRYCHYPNGTPGCEFWAVDEWVTIMVHIFTPTFNGSAGNLFEVWYARRFATQWTKLFEDHNYSVGNPDSNGGGFTHINGGHLLTFETNRVATATGNVACNHKYDQLVVATQPVALPAPI